MNISVTEGLPIIDITEFTQTVHVIYLLCILNKRFKTIFYRCDNDSWLSEVM